PEARRDLPRVGPPLHRRRGRPAARPPRPHRAGGGRIGGARGAPPKDLPARAMRGGEIDVVGPPHAGKSTPRNTLVGEKVSIVSDKPQTTRTRVLGVVRRRDAEIALVDTPGIHRPQYRMNAAMVREATDALSGADAILFVVDAAEERGAGDAAVAE